MIYNQAQPLDLDFAKFWLELDGHSLDFQVQDFDDLSRSYQGLELIPDLQAVEDFSHLEIKTNLKLSQADYLDDNATQAVSQWLYQGIQFAVLACEPGVDFEDNEFWPISIEDLAFPVFIAFDVDYRDQYRFAILWQDASSDDPDPFGHIDYSWYE